MTDTTSRARAYSIERALRCKLDNVQRAIVEHLTRFPPEPGHRHWHVFQRGRHGQPNIHAPTCESFAAWRAGFACYLRDLPPIRHPVRTLRPLSWRCDYGVCLWIFYDIGDDTIAPALIESESWEWLLISRGNLDASL